MRIGGGRARESVSVRLHALVVAVLLGTGCQAAPQVVEQARKQELTPEQRAQNLESFEYVWKAIRDKHWDPALGGLDWAQVRAELEPRLTAATSMAEARQVLSDMLARLGQSHFAIIPRTYYDMPNESSGAAGSASGSDASGIALDPPPKGPRGDHGLEFRSLGGEIVVTRVASEEAASLGVAPGWVLTGIRGAPVLADRSETSDIAAPTAEAAVARSIDLRLGGNVGERIPVTFRDAGEREREIALPIVAREGTPTRFGHLPETWVRFESRHIAPAAGYIAFNCFLDPSVVSQGFDRAITEFMDAKGIVIDLRGNPGGIGLMAMGMAGWLVDSPGFELGTMKLRDGELRFAVIPRPETYGGAVALLVDALSGSTSEIFAGGLQDLGRARVFGTRTMGAALPSVVEELPNGDRFQYAVANYVSKGGKPLEGNGVPPDVEVSPTRAGLLAGRDEVLEAALAWIQEQPEGK